MGTFFIQSGTGVQFTPEQLGGFTAALPSSTYSNGQVTNLTQPNGASTNNQTLLISNATLTLIPTSSQSPTVIPGGSSDVMGSVSVVYTPPQDNNFFDNFSANKNFQTGYDQVQKAAEQTAFVAAGTAVGAVIGGVVGFVAGGTAGSVVPVAGTAAVGVAGAATGAEAGAVAGAVFAGYILTAYDVLQAGLEISNGQANSGASNLATTGTKELVKTSTVAGQSLGNTIPLLGPLITITQGVLNIGIGAGQASLETFYGTQ
jgi:hypothetical protein